MMVAIFSSLKKSQTSAGGGKVNSALLIIASFRDKNAIFDFFLLVLAIVIHNL
jgi:hypothetical protein